jgi:hypothetical protein
MHSQMKLEYPDPSSLSVKKTKAGALMGLVVSLGFIIAWDVSVLVGFLPEITGQSPASLLTLQGLFTIVRLLADGGTVGWMFIVAQLILLIHLLLSLKACLFGEVLLFDGVARAISRNGKQRALFSDCRGVEIRTVSGADLPEYWVSILLHGGGSLWVASDTRQEPMAHLAGDIARVLNLEVFTARR